MADGGGAVMRPVAVVTGAASGIGRATALRLGREGYELALMDIGASGLVETCAQVDQQGGVAHALQVDLCDPDEVGSVVRTVAVDIGQPALLVNVARIGVAATVLETSDENWQRVLAVNLTGLFLTTRAILPLMVDARRGDR
jgi:NAD(P)-dependent dehydrogenase (short-subunit alcohol dehydrogenase family)